MQQPPTGYGQSPQWYGQQQPAPPSEQWVQQPFTSYPPQQGFAPQQPYPPQQGQWQQLFTPNPQWVQQPYGQPPPQQPKEPKKVNVVKSLVLAFGSNAFGATIQEVAIEAFYMNDQTTSYQTA